MAIEIQFSIAIFIFCGFIYYWATILCVFFTLVCLITDIAALKPMVTQYG